MNPYRSGIRHSIALCSLLVLALALGGCVQLPEREPAPSSWTIRHGDTALSKVVARDVAIHPTESGALLLNDPMDAFVARFGMVEAAQQSLDLQYYIWHDDLTGRALQARLLSAADRGVRVRILLDDLDTAGKSDVLFGLDAHPNIEIRLFNPFAKRDQRVSGFLTDFSRVNRRMHNKTFTVDNALTILGGRNIGDEYFNATEEVVFGDLDVMCQGPVVEEVSIQFDLYWNSPWAYPLARFGEGRSPDADLEAYRALAERQFEEARASQYAKALAAATDRLRTLEGDDFSWGPAKLIYDDPAKVAGLSLSSDTHLAPELLKAMAQVERDLMIVSPYFVPGERLTRYLVSMVERGIRVRIITNSLAANDVPVVHAGYMRYREALVAGGVELYEYKAPLEEPKKEDSAPFWKGASQGSLHAKSLVLEEQVLFVGSFNVDARSVSLNTEIGVLIYSPAYAEHFSDEVDRVILNLAYQVILEEGELVWVTRHNGDLVRFDTEPDTSWWTRFSTGFLRYVVPEKLL
ncbi:phospholipase D family protein [Ferrimonas balearica]|uniref:phospholipase D family protein n=1 Tax=Ferrimonas balearica TaxID=44012 RepID=UPI001C98E75E|nr:phospholipase D family protein [Ferrimonas balearica]MBY5921077.1 phospholipase D family protein [Ferrimonas balearica]MBY5996238.1 phospholipase D family protein [Ferrimonas balearica]